MKCAYCEYNDGLVYTSIPPKYRCTITNEFHLEFDDCDVEFTPVRHGRWVELHPLKNIFTCSLCGQWGDYHWNYCPNCGAKMDEVEE